jgi:hypothetical protein
VRGILRVDDRRPARHGQHEVAQQRPQGEVGRAARRRDDQPLGRTDQLVVTDDAAMGVELATHLQRDGVPALLRVGELDPVTRAERPAPLLGAGRRHRRCH